MLQPRSLGGCIFSIMTHTFNPTPAFYLILFYYLFI